MCVCAEAQTPEPSSSGGEAEVAIGARGRGEPGGEEAPGGEQLSASMAMRKSLKRPRDGSSEADVSLGRPSRLSSASSEGANAAPALPLPPTHLFAGARAMWGGAESSDEDDAVPLSQRLYPSGASGHHRAGGSTASTGKEDSASRRAPPKRKPNPALRRRICELWLSGSLRKTGGQYTGSGCTCHVACLHLPIITLSNASKLASEGVSVFALYVEQVAPDFQLTPSLFQATMDGLLAPHLPSECRKGCGCVTHGKRHIKHLLINENAVTIEQSYKAIEKESASFKGTPLTITPPDRAQLHVASLQALRSKATPGQPSPPNASRGHQAGETAAAGRSAGETAAAAAKAAPKPKTPPTRKAAVPKAAASSATRRIASKPSTTDTQHKLGLTDVGELERVMDAGLSLAEDKLPESERKQTVSSLVKIRGLLRLALPVRAPLPFA